MRSRLACLFLLVVSRSHAGGLQELAAKVKPSVVLLTVHDASGEKIATGTGFFISSDGRIITNYHVIDHAPAITATLAGDRKIEVTGILVSDEAKDLAILKVPGDGFPALGLGDSHALHIGDEIVVVGSPMGLSTTVSAGIVSALRDAKGLDAIKESLGGKPEHSMESWGIQISAAVSPGSSGSPIMSTDGLVVGVAVGKLVGGESLNFGIPVDEVKTLLGRAATAKMQSFDESDNRDVRRNLLISAAFFAVLGFGYLVFVVISRRHRRRKSAPAKQHFVH